MQFVDAVRGHRQAARRGQLGDFEPGADAANVGHVRFRERHPPGVDQVREFAHRAQVFAGRQRHPAGLGHAAVAGVVVRRDRLLQPVHPEPRQFPRRGNRLRHAPAHVGIHHQRRRGAHQIAHRRYPLQVLAQGVAPHLHLDRAMALVERAAGLLQQLLQRQQQIDPPQVGRHRLRLGRAEQPPQRLLPRQPAQIPQRNVDRGDGERGEAAAPHVVGALPHVAPQRRYVIAVGAAQQRRQVLFDQRFNRRAAGMHGVGVAESGMPALGRHQRQHQVVVIVPPVGRVGERRGEWNPVPGGDQVVDLHRRSSYPNHTMLACSARSAAAWSRAASAR